MTIMDVLSDPSLQAQMQRMLAVQGAFSPQSPSLFKDVEIERSGGKITLPEGMSYDEGVQWLQRQKANDEKTIKISHTIDAYPLDGAYAFHKALARTHGWTEMIPTPGFWGTQDPPQMIGVDVGGGKVEQVCWGRVAVPGIKGFIETGIDLKDGRFVFQLSATMRNADKQAFADITALTREIVKAESIYRAKAIEISFANGGLDKNGQPLFNINDVPKFLDMSDTDTELVFSDSVNNAIETNIFIPIEKTEQCRKHKIPLKRGVLLEGRYGTGKTLTASVAKHKCVANGWTFIYLRETVDLERALVFASQYAPAVVFVEDIDRVLDGDRDADMDKILNTIDGIGLKSAELMVVMTTNFVEKINSAMIRPGRLDAVISVEPPDRDAAIRLLRLYGQDLIRINEDLGPVGDKLAGHIPAVIREVVERSKLQAIRHHAGAGKSLKVTADDLLHAAEGMIKHLALLDRPEPRKQSKLEVLGHTLGHYLLEAGREARALKALPPGQSVNGTIAELVRG